VVARKNRTFQRGWGVVDALERTNPFIERNGGGKNEQAQEELPYEKLVGHRSPWAMASKLYTVRTVAYDELNETKSVLENERKNIQIERKA